MKKGLLITLPTSDDATEYLSVFSAPIIEECKQRDVKVKALRQKQATRKEFEKNLKELDYNFIVLNGHGRDTAITGHNGEQIIILGENENLLSKRITYARSCWAASKVGRKCVEDDNGGCFIGYELPFMFLMDDTWATNPIKDNTAKVFFDTSNIIPLEIIKGGTTSNSHEKSKKAMLKAIKKSLMKGDRDSQSIAEILWNNYSAQVLLGNPEATI